jgi:hypothetical protein
LKLTQANSSRDPISKIPNTKRAGGVAQGVGPECKPQYHKTKTNHHGANEVFKGENVGRGAKEGNLTLYAKNYQQLRSRRSQSSCL